MQDDPCKNDGGFVKLEFIDNSKETNWQDKVLERLPVIIKSVQDKGYKASEIGIIVRDGKEGGLVLNSLIGYNNKCQAEEKNLYNFNVCFKTIHYCYPTLLLLFSSSL